MENDEGLDWELVHWVDAEAVGMRTKEMKFLKLTLKGNSNAPLIHTY